MAKNVIFFNIGQMNPVNMLPPRSFKIQDIPGSAHKGEVAMLPPNLIISYLFLELIEFVISSGIWTWALSWSELLYRLLKPISHQGWITTRNYVIAAAKFVAGVFYKLTGQ